MGSRAEIICVGTELLTGRVNTHTAYLGQQLSSVGLEVLTEQTVGDNPKVMEQVFRTALNRSTIIFCCGGLGPTFDDITRNGWSRILKRPLQLHTKLVEDIRLKFKQRGIPMPPLNKRQAYVLKGALILPNLKGTAPGQYLAMGEKIIFLLPGPTRELVEMVERFVIPILRSKMDSSYIAQREFHAIGFPESKIDAMVRPLVSKYKAVRGHLVTHGILASQSIVTVKFSIKGKNQIPTEAAADFLSAKFRKRLTGIIFGEFTDTLPGVLADLLVSRKKTLAVAESCTGGLIAKTITDLSGASDYFVEGVVTYSNASKQRQLGVSRKSLIKYGAVSEQVAKEMAVGLRKKSGVDYALSVTGVAGPTGGTEEKPVGLVYIGCSGPHQTMVKKFQFSGDREWIRHRAALIALDVLRKELLA